MKRSIQEVPEPASCSCSSAVPEPARAGGGGESTRQTEKIKTNLPARRLYVLAGAVSVLHRLCCLLRRVAPPCLLPPQSGALVLLGWRVSLLSEAPSSRCTSLAPHWTRLSFSCSDVRSLRSSSHRHHESESRTRMEHAPVPSMMLLLLLKVSALCAQARDMLSSP